MGLITSIAVTFTDRKPNYLLICAWEHFDSKKNKFLPAYISVYQYVLYFVINVKEYQKLFEYEHYAMYISSVLIGYMQMTEKIKFIYINQLNQLDYTANEMAFTIK